MDNKENIKIIANNKRAYHDYEVVEEYEAGIELTGTEIKSIRMGKCSINECYCDFVKGELFVVNMNITEYEKGNIFNHAPKRNRKLLLHKNELIKLSYKVSKDHFTIIPLRVILKGSLCKVDIALAKGKKLYDKKEALKEKDIKRLEEKEK